MQFHEAVNRHAVFSKTTKMAAYTYDPHTNRVYDGFNPEHRKAMLEQYGDGTHNLYMIGVTNNTKGGIPHNAQRKYEIISSEGQTPMFGKWHDDKANLDYVDVSYPVSADRDTIVTLLKKHRQKSAFVAYRKSGRAGFRYNPNMKNGEING